MTQLCNLESKITMHARIQKVLSEGSTFDNVFMPPTLKKLKGHIALGLSVRPSIRYKFKIGF